MAAVSADLDAALVRATPDDGASWWAGDSKGFEQAVRILFFHEQSAALAQLLADDRMAWLVTQTGDLTVHCSDTLHRAYPPIERPRKVVYTGFHQALMQGDKVAQVPVEKERAARARLSNVQERIAAAGNTAQ